MSPPTTPTGRSSRRGWGAHSAGLANTDDAFALYDEIPFDFTMDEFTEYATDKGMRRLGTIGSTRGRPLAEIDVDYSPLQLEDTFADEDRQALATSA